MEMEKEGKTMAVRLSKLEIGSSSNSESLRSTDVSDPSLDVSVPPRSQAKPKKERSSHDLVRTYAMEAISVYNKKTWTKYELVEPGNISDALLPNCLLHHIDFTAKKTDVADAPEEMFFAELKTIDQDTSVTCSRCMGPKESISGDKNNGCCYCKDYNVQHPRGGGFMAGRAGLFIDI